MHKPLYKIIYADPAWPYRNVKTGGSMSSGAAAKYPVMSLNDICNLNIESITDKNAVCFLWVTTPLLPDGLTVLKAWGFTYKTSLYWHKSGRIGLGYWYRGNVEQCLFGIKGKITAFRIPKPNIITAPAGRHSEKPDGMRKMIELSGLEPKIELFARSRAAGWHVWGNEVNSDIDLEIKAAGNE